MANRARAAPQHRSNHGRRHGLSDIGAYGGEIDTPNIDQLASKGVKFRRFTNAARCCPTRASLMSGLYPHQAGIGGMDDDMGLPAYSGELNNNCVTMAECYAGAGSSTYATGKWHLTTYNHTGTNGDWRAEKTSDFVPEADKKNWPIQRGFDSYYGIIGGAADYFQPNTLTRDNERLPKPEKADGYYTTDAFSEYTADTIAAQPQRQAVLFLRRVQRAALAARRQTRRSWPNTKANLTRAGTFCASSDSSA